MAKDINANSLPETLYENNVEIPSNEQAEVFAKKNFSGKVIKIPNSVNISPEVNNGKK